MANEVKVQKSVGIQKGATASDDLFDSKKVIQSTHTSELVIALCGPIGSPLHRVADNLKQLLTSDFGYQRCEVIKLSDIIEQHSNNSPMSSDPFKRIKELIRLGDELRRKHGSGVLAELAISKIVVDRELSKNADGATAPVPRRVCHIIDSIKNQEELDVLRLVYRELLYTVGVFSPLPNREKALEKKGMKNSQVWELIDQDSGEEIDHGQTVRDTFPQSDFFLRMDAETDSQIKGRVDRFLHLILGTRIITPTPSETAMYLAASAAGNSACLSRQVGASVTDANGEILSVGWNDVPKFGGNLYQSDPARNATSDDDKRCWNIDGGVCSNDREKRVIATAIVNQLEKYISETNRDNAITEVIKNGKVGSLIEFSRSIHAEMHAIINASQLNGDRVKNGKLFCTTYPCHSCARHIIAAGIKDVYYIEPYRKSLATKLHGDAITESETDSGKVRILSYDGVAPSRYLRLFRMQPNSRKREGKMIQIDPKTASPKFDKSIEAFPTLELLVVKELKKKNLIAGEQGATKNE